MVFESLDNTDNNAFLHSIGTVAKYLDKTSLICCSNMEPPENFIPSLPQLKTRTANKLVEQSLIYKTFGLYDFIADEESHTVAKGRLVFSNL